MRNLLVPIAATLSLLLANAADAQQKKELVWCAPTIASSYYWDVLAGVDLGYFEQEGISLKLVNNDTPVQGLQFLATGACNIGSITTELAISAVDKGADFKFVGSEDDRISFVLLSRPEIKGFDDLRGKTIGVTQLQESTATMIRLMLEKHGIKRDEYNYIALGGSPNRYAALVRGAVSATMLSPPFDYKAMAEGMKRMGSAFEAFEGVGVLFVVPNAWAKANSDTLVAFLRAALKAEKFLYDPANKQKAVDILVKITKSPPGDIAKSYDSFYGTDKVMSSEFQLTDKMLQPWLDLRGSKENPERYIDMSYVKQAHGH